MSEPLAMRQSRLRKTALAGIALAERLTLYFPPANRIDPLLDCDLEIRLMADKLLAGAKGLK